MFKGLNELKELIGLYDVCFLEFCARYKKIIIFGAYPPGEKIRKYIEKSLKYNGGGMY